ncbi:MAG TPA: ATP-dependent zinc metalloprotease FtsH [Chloroflexota bacterium]
MSESKPPSGRRPISPGQPRWSRSVALLLVALATAAGLLAAARLSAGRDVADMSTSELIRQAKLGQISAITAGADGLLVERTTPPTTAHVRTDPKTDVYALLDTAGVPRERVDQIAITYAPPADVGWSRLLVLILPIVLLGLFLFWMMRRSQGVGPTALSFGRSRARRFVGSRSGVTFADVAGADEATHELREVVEFLTGPEKFAALGARIPRGVLLVGPPGTGKTLLARAVAGEASVPFFSISGSEFVEMFVGVGASRVRDLFDQAKKEAPCIVFVDEVDAVGRQRGVGLGGGNDEREQTLNQILVEMDGFGTDTNVVVMAATNRPDVLDPALLRPGRFDRQVVLDRPDINGRKAVLAVHSKGKPLDKSVEIEVLAKQTAGFSGADLANLLNEAAILAARRNKKTIGLSELEEAVDRVMAGPERKSRVISDKEKEITAYHEAGHAVVAKFLRNVDPLHKVTIIPRGMMGGYTRLLPTEDRYLYTKSTFEDMLVFALGGRVAEDLVYSEITTGAENDIERATQMARRMVTEYGMSKRLGPVALGHKEELVFLGREIAEQKNYSEKIAEAIDEEIRSLIDTADSRAREILKNHRDALERLAKALIKYETMEGDELERVFHDGTERESSLAPAPAAL